MKVRRLTMLLVMGFWVIFTTFEVIAKPVDIQFWYSQAGGREDTLREIVDAFNQSQGEYTVVPVNKGSYDETMNAGIAAFRSKNPPHILQVYDVGTQTMMLSNAIYPVYNLMKDTGNRIDWKGYLQPVLSYYESSNGELQSMPFNSSTPVMYYNKDIFKKAGLTDPPRTWDDMGKDTAKLVACGVQYGMVTAWQTWIMIENYSAIQNIPISTEANGFDGLNASLTINHPLIVHHFERLKKWMNDKRFVYEGREYRKANAAFLSGKCAILMDSTSTIGVLKTEAKFNWAAAPLPVEVSNKEPQNSIIGGASLWVLKGHPEADYRGVARFLKFLSSQDMQILWHKETGYLPITVNAYEALNTSGYYQKNPAQEVGILQLTRKAPTIYSRGIRLGNFTQIRVVMNDELEMLWQGKKTAQQALDDAVRRGNEILRKFDMSNQ